MKYKQVLKVRMAASSIVEVTTALVIISMIFSLAMIIYLNVQRSGISFRKVDGVIMMEEVYAETKNLKKYEDRTEEREDIIIYQKVSASGESPDLLVIQLEARDAQGKVIAEQKHLIYAPAQP